MRRSHFSLLQVIPAVLILLVLPLISLAGEVERPEEIKSKRQVIYDDDTYAKLAHLWKAYYDEYPSEYAYANWMYAARYAGDKDYPSLLAEGIEKYTFNPILLYLQSMILDKTNDGMEGRKQLEKAVALDPGYSDPWFSLVIHYMESREEEQLDLSLRRLLESGAVADEVMDYNYNVLISLEKNAILITNGDNDTYPAWILKRILDIRPDVNIVNRSLLNTAWYPLYVIEQGLPRFIGKDELERLRNKILDDLQNRKTEASPAGLFADTLVEEIISSADRAGRPVYFAQTLYVTDRLRDYVNNGRDLALAVLVTPSDIYYDKQLQELYKTWAQDFRTGGLASWRLRFATDSDAGRFVYRNYAYGIALLTQLQDKFSDDLTSNIFRWYRKNLEENLPEDIKYRMAYSWCCGTSDLDEVEAWCRQQGIKCEENGK